MYANTLSSCSTLSARSYDTLFHFPRWCQGLYLVLFRIVRYGWKCSVQSLFVCPPKIKWKTNKNRQQQQQRHEIEFNLLVIIAVQVTTGGKLADTWKCSLCENTRLYSKLNGCAVLCYVLTVAKITDLQTHRTRRTMAKHLVPSIDIKYVHRVLDTNTSANAHQYGWGKAHYRMDFVSKSSSNHYGNSRAYVMIYIRCIRDSYFAIENKGILCRSLARSLCHYLGLLFPLSQTHYIHQSQPMFGMCTMVIRIVFHECCSNAASILARSTLLSCLCCLCSFTI